MKAWDFLAAPDAERLYARLDYLLRAGVHIQSNVEQQELFIYLSKNEDSIREYYSRFYKLYLDEGGTGRDKYYYLNFQNGVRGPVTDQYRNYLKPEYVIVGLLLNKAMFIEGDIGLNSVRKFQNKIRVEYDDLKSDLNRLFGKNRTSVSSTQTLDDRIDIVVVDAIKEFKKLGWVSMDGNDSFNVEPSFQRLVKLYEDKINNIDELLKNTE